MNYIITIEYPGEINAGIFKRSYEILVKDIELDDKIERLNFLRDIATKIQAVYNELEGSTKSKVYIRKESP